MPEGLQAANDSKKAELQGREAARRKTVRFCKKRITMSVINNGVWVRVRVAHRLQEG